MSEKSVELRLVVDRLNSMLAVDPDAIEALVNHRIDCNETLAGHPTCQVRARKGGGPPYTVGFLGVINGILGIDDRGWGPIAANHRVVCDECGEELDAAPGTEHAGCEADVQPGTSVLGPIVEFSLTENFE